MTGNATDEATGFHFLFSEQLKQGRDNTIPKHSESCQILAMWLDPVTVSLSVGITGIEYMESKQYNKWILCALCRL